MNIPRLTPRGAATLYQNTPWPYLLGSLGSLGAGCLDEFSRWSRSLSQESSESVSESLDSCPSFSVPGCSLTYVSESCPGPGSLFSASGSLSVSGSSLPLVIEQAASAWVWCPCSCMSSPSSASLSCPMSDVCTDKTAGEGGWFFLAGDQSLGPPCITGDYYGQVSIIAWCPTRQPSCSIPSHSLISSPSSSSPSSSLSSPSLSSASLPSRSWSVCEDTGSLAPECAPPSPELCDLPTWPPPEWQFDRAHCEPEADRCIPQIIVSKETAGDSAVWTWCPCIADYDDYPQSSSSLCPWSGTSCDSGSGYWVFRGGNANIPQPCVDGRFYGETIITGECCSLSSSSLSSSLSSLSSLSSISSLSSPSLSSESPSSRSWSVCEDTGSLAPECELPSSEPCNLPSWPALGFGQPPCSVSSSSGALESIFDELLVNCQAWIWCPCDCGDYSAPAVAGECPQTLACVGDQTEGWWVPFDGTAAGMPPCRPGRFFNEVAYVCECALCSPSSSLSSSSWPWPWSSSSSSSSMSSGP